MRHRDALTGGRPGSEVTVPELTRPDADRVTIRPALSEDALTLLGWRNDPSVRAASRNTEIIEESAHLRWYESALASPTRLLLVGLLDGNPYGMVRFDRHEPPLWEVSILVAVQARGRGYGQPLLREALAYFHGQHPRTPVLAVVKKDNITSRRLFLSLQFVEKSREGDRIDFLLDPERACHQ